MTIKNDYGKRVICNICERMAALRDGEDAARQVAEAVGFTLIKDNAYLCKECTQLAREVLL